MGGGWGEGFVLPDTNPNKTPESCRYLSLLRGIFQRKKCPFNQLEEKLSSELQILWLPTTKHFCHWYTFYQEKDLHFPHIRPLLKVLTCFILHYFYLFAVQLVLKYPKYPPIKASHKIFSSFIRCILQALLMPLFVMRLTSLGVFMYLENGSWLFAAGFAAPPAHTGSCSPAGRRLPTRVGAPA